MAASERKAVKKAVKPDQQSGAGKKRNALRGEGLGRGAGRLKFDPFDSQLLRADFLNQWISKTQAREDSGRGRSSPAIHRPGLKFPLLCADAHISRLEPQPGPTMVTHDTLESQTLKEKMHNPVLQSLLRAYFRS